MVDPVVPLLGGLLGAVTSNLLAELIKLTDKGYDLWSNFDTDIKFIKSELRVIAGAEEDPSIVMREQVHELAFEIEDLLDQIQRYVVEGGKIPFHEVLNFPNKLALENKVKKLKDRLKEAYSLNSANNIHGNHQPSPSSSPPNTYATRIGPVGIDESEKEICDWVMKDVEGHPEQQSVISIVGFSGSGKSTLAKAVFNSPVVANRFPHPHRACVVASKHGGNLMGLLTELLEKLGQRDQIISDSGDIEQLQTKISNYLKHTKRYLIVLDDIKKQSWWDGIKSAFPEKATGRIIVTTAIRSIARSCSRGDGYVHNMAALDDAHSKKLMEAILKKPFPGLEKISQPSIVNKCDGHPHALVAAANYLQKMSVVTNGNCDKLSENVGSLMTTDNALEELQQVLMNNYRSLPKNIPNLKTCLLYLCVFPNGSHISGSRLMRRCLAEGYGQNDSGLKVTDELGDQSVVWPIDTYYENGSVKTCRAHCIFYELLLQMSRSTNFIACLENENRRYYRHLFLFSGKASLGGRSSDGKDKPRAHSLTICGNAGEAVGYFDKCQLLRVLDLEECNDLKDEDLDGIHKLWHLKYLSVGNTISRLPKDIEKLHCLETLDMRKTKKEIILPVEVLKMPHLSHLLGRFKLDNKKNWDTSNPQQYVPATSNLQTLAGFVTDDNHMFQMLMDEMKQLRKVKIWATLDEDPYLERSITKFVVADMCTCAAVRSLSLDIGNSSGDILRPLAGGILRSLKLQGNMNALVEFVSKLEFNCELYYFVKELCLSSTNNDNNLKGIALSRLREFKRLEYLKLVGLDLEGFVIESEDFKGLLRLCLVQCPSLPTITQGAVPYLLSLRLLNQGLDGLSDIKIECLKLLEEVALDSEVKPKTRKEWEDAAKKHPRRPKILFFKRVHPDGMGCMVKYVAIEKPPPETEPAIVGRTGDIDAVRSGVKTNSGLKQMELSEASGTSTKLPTARNDDMPSSSSACPNRGDCILSNGWEATC